MARILVVDDDPAIRALISTLLRDDGHEVQLAADGVNAIELVEEAVPDLIVLDLSMPQMDGWTVLEELYARDLRKQTRVVIVSANLDAGARSRAQGEDVSGLLDKPFDPDALTTLVNEALERDPDELAVHRDRSGELIKLIEKVDRILH